mmetsp:Transcript_17740/g.46816  ORF Transcript_17740/g.46816 Transcript_17740/m.46816 type:complete len:209 (+) Transcript_17740:680-1306(+)
MAPSWSPMRLFAAPRLPQAMASVGSRVSASVQSCKASRMSSRFILEAPLRDQVRALVGSRSSAFVRSSVAPSKQPNLILVAPRVDHAWAHLSSRLSAASASTWAPAKSSLRTFASPRVHKAPTKPGCRCSASVQSSIAPWKSPFFSLPTAWACRSEAPRPCWAPAGALDLAPAPAPMWDQPQGTHSRWGRPGRLRPPPQPKDDQGRTA